MNEMIILMGWIGIYAPMALSAFGSTVGCAIAGQAAIGAMLDTESGYGRYVGVSAMPSSMVIYGIVIMFTLNRVVTPEASLGMFAIGVLSGLTLLAAAIYQGHCCASSILASKAKPEIFGLSVVPAAIVEGFAVFVFIFALVISGNIPNS